MRCADEPTIVKVRKTRELRPVFFFRIDHADRIRAMIAQKPKARNFMRLETLARDDRRVGLDINVSSIELLRSAFKKISPTSPFEK